MTTIQSIRHRLILRYNCVDDDDEDTHHVSLCLYGSLPARNIIIILHGNVSCTFHRLSESIIHSLVRLRGASERVREHGLYVSTYRSFIA